MNEQEHIQSVEIVKRILFSELLKGDIDVDRTAEKIVLNLFYSTKNTNEDGSN